jgi:IS605 OrfB family transposase
MKTFQFRIKDSSKKTKLKALASKVNFVWNYCNQVSEFAWKRDKKWLSEFDLNNLTSGSSKELKLRSSTIQSICAEYAARRNAAKRSKISWRSFKRSLGWIPVKSNGFKLKNDTVIFQKQTYKIWKSRSLFGIVKTATFSQNSKGNWFINIVCRTEKVESNNNEVIGIDLGLKTLATLSNGEKIENPKILSQYEQKLAFAQRANKKKQVTNIHNKIKNIRKDFLHKETTKLTKKYNKIYIGNVSSLKLAKTKLAKSVNDASWGLFKSLLNYKAISLGGELIITNENHSSITCGVCFLKTGPTGLSKLGVRKWTCSACNSHHDRDVNAAKNILTFGLGH